ncbi:unnamed protein product [Gongylonema pulchrum]|uniref:AAA_12 domain-containing protein n=1 Tax=Gongylonema pulchrum TaxID=637853 RepID=A0A183EAE3_9BILA|nr:unnamed protein product [Gongylonema pulchrum]
MAKVCEGYDVPLNSSVEASQGKEVEIAIVITTRAASPANTPDLGFVGDPQRAAVALSRARQGQIVVGYFETLFRTSYWRGLLKSFNEKILIVGQDYVEHLKSQKANYINGILLDDAYTPSAIDLPWAPREY